MRKAEKEYKKLLAKRQNINKKLELLKKDSGVQEYISLCNEDAELESLQEELYKKMKLEQYAKCRHIWIKVSDKTFYGSYGCIKCGLDGRVYDRVHYKEFDTDEEIMFDYICDNPSSKDDAIEVLCDFELAKAIITRIKEIHPHIDDKTLRKYFEIALDNIRQIKVSPEREKSRVKRLKLNTDFNNWK